MDGSWEAPVAIDVSAGLPAPHTTLDPWVIALSSTRLRSAKYAYTTRYVAESIARQPNGYFLQAAPTPGRDRVMWCWRRWWSSAITGGWRAR